MSNTTSIALSFENTPVLFTQDAFINATSIAKHFNKLPKDYLKLDTTKEYINAVRTIILTEQDQLVIIKKGGIPENQGTWLHPKLAIDFARWCSAKFAVWCDTQIENILHPKQPQPIVNPIPLKQSGLIINKITIRKECGYYCLNDILKAAGKVYRKKVPNRFLRNKSTHDLMETIEQGPSKRNVACYNAEDGRHPIVYACLEMVHAYTKWIDYPFYTKVKNAIRRDDNTPTLPPVQKLDSHEENVFPSLPHDTTHGEIKIEEGRIVSLRDLKDKKIVDAQLLTTIRSNIKLLGEQLRHLEGDIAFDKKQTFSYCDIERNVTKNNEAHNLLNFFFDNLILTADKPAQQTHKSFEMMKELVSQYICKEDFYQKGHRS